MVPMICPARILYCDSWRILCGLVKASVYHTLGTLMPYPSEDPPRVSVFLLIDGCFILVLQLIAP